MMKTRTEFKQTEIGMIPEDWEVEKIDILYEISSGLSKPRNEFGFGHPFLSFKNIFDNFSLPKELHELVNSSERERKHCSIMRGDVFLTRTSETIGELGMSSVALKNYENATFNGFAKRLRPKRKDIILPEFAVYLFRSNKIRSQILSFSSLTTRASLNASMIKEIRLIIPSLREQSAIATILSDLDSKIKVNQQMNKTLEAMGQTLFKHWFIDFEFPNEKGKPYRSSGGKMVDSELGEIPKGWQVKKVGDAIDIFGGTTPSTKEPKYWEGGTNHWATPKDLSELDSPVLIDTERKITPQGLATISSGLLPAGTVLLSSRAPIGYTAISQIPVSINQGFIAMVCSHELPNYYVFSWVEYNLHIIKSVASGTTFEEVNKSNFRRLDILVPPSGLLSKFSTIFGSLYECILNNSFQTRTLALVRDSLLPRLMSGEIRVNAHGSGGCC